MTVWETICSGEFVMLGLAAIFVAVAVIWLSRVIFLRKQNNTYPGLMQRIRDHVVEGDIENARSQCHSVSSPGARVIDAGLARVGHTMSEVTSAMHQETDIEKNKLRRGQRWLKFFAVVSPLAGLGGTLVGITYRLRDLGLSDTPVDTSMVCAAIAPAVVTTVAGLITGIFSLIAYTSLDASLASSERKIDELSVEFNDLLNEPS